MDISFEHLATLLTSIAALVGTFILLRKAKSEVPQIDAGTEKSNVETIKMLSGQLNEAYAQIDELRKMIGDLDCHKEYQDYLLRGIARLHASLAANEISVPWIPMSFEEYVKKHKTSG